MSLIDESIKYTILQIDGLSEREETKQRAAIIATGKKPLITFAPFSSKYLMHVSGGLGYFDKQGVYRPYEYAN